MCSKNNQSWFHALAIVTVFIPSCQWYMSLSRPKPQIWKTGQISIFQNLNFQQFNFLQMELKSMPCAHSFIHFFDFISKKSTSIN